MRLESGINVTGKRVLLHHELVHVWFGDWIVIIQIGLVEFDISRLTSSAMLLRNAFRELLIHGSTR